MSPLQNRVAALEKAHAPSRMKIEVLMLCTPGDQDPHAAWIMDGPNRNTQLLRSDGEDRAEFEARVDRVRLGALLEVVCDE